MSEEKKAVHEPKPAHTCQACWESDKFGVHTCGYEWPPEPLDDPWYWRGKNWAYSPSRGAYEIK